MGIFSWLFRAWLFRAWLFRAWLFREVPFVKALMLFSRNPEISFTRYARRFTERLGGEAEIILPSALCLPCLHLSLTNRNYYEWPPLFLLFLWVCAYLFLHYITRNSTPTPHKYIMDSSYSVFVRLDY